MSRRAIRRYEQELEASNLSGKCLSEQSDEEHADSQTLAPSPQRAQGLFALLADQELVESSEDDAHHLLAPASPSKDALNLLASTHVPAERLSDHEAHDINASHPSQTDQNQAPEAVFPSALDIGTGKKKKKKKRRGKKLITAENDPDWIALNEADPSAAKVYESVTPGMIPSSYFAPGDGEYIRAEAVNIMTMIEELALERQTGSNAVGKSCTAELSTVLHVEPRLLNSDSELKRLFGSRVIETQRRGDEPTATATGRQRGRTGGRSHLRRKVSIVSPRDTWIGEAPGLAMVLDNEATANDLDGIRYYRYIYEASYSRIQEEYRVLVGTHDPNMLVGLCSTYPYHADTLLQLAEVNRQMGELDRAAEMVERCLYVLETAWNIGFKPYDGTCRLRFDVLENRSLYVALFRYSQLLTRRGLHRTALEISKLILNFDPANDPMGLLMLSDSFALLSGEYGWIQDMLSKFSCIPIQYFPNFAASSALACESIRLGITGISNRGSTSKGKKGRMHLKGIDEDAEGRQRTKELLTDALLTFPMLLRPLLSAIQDESAVWTEHRLFDEAWYSAGCNDYAILVRICRVYAERSKLLWKSSEKKALLVDCARVAGTLDTAAGSGPDPKSGRLSSAYVSDISKHQRVARCRALRSEAADWFATSGLYRGVQIADFTDATAPIPQFGEEAAEETVGAPAPREVSVTEGAWEFLQSLLPWREARDAQHQNP